MSVLTKEFAEALGRIEPDEDVRSAMRARDDVIAVLGADEQLADWGLSPILIGSYKRNVSIKRIKDVDVFCRLDALPADVAPDQLLDHLERVLIDSFGADAVNGQGRSVQVTFSALDMYVDAVPARRSASHWEIPKRGEAAWEETDPEQLTKLSSEMNSRFGEKYVPTVKLMRQARRALMGEEKPGGLYIECATYWAFDGFHEDGFTSQAAYFVNAMESVADLVRGHANGVEIENPAMPGRSLNVRATKEQLVAMADTYMDAARLAREALVTDDACHAAQTYQQLLGEDSLGEIVFRVPEDCTSYAESKSGFAIRPGADRLPAADSPRFG